ncbi:MAG: DUF192 domain-containing protein [Deltaproteobacteria bacterium]|nr:DUF192 domain-containing protein [Deltaproteobacteria bacterium]
MMHRTGIPLIISLAALVLMGAGPCARSGPRVCVETGDGGTVCVDVEVVRTVSERRFGLMYRRSLPADAGMLFVFDDDRVNRFTMKNTFIPLDMVFVGRELRVAGIAARTKPLTPGPYGVEAPSRYVLEVNGGFCRRNGIKKGDRVELQNIAR